MGKDIKMEKDKKILVVLTNRDHFDDGEKTGLWLSEVAEFVYEVTDKGFRVDYVSSEGGRVEIDPRSLKKQYTDKDTLLIYESDDFKERALKNSLRPSEINADEYMAIYYTGGHGVLWDFPDNGELRGLASDIYENGGYVCSVCHGIAGILNIRDKNGKYLIEGKKITGFTNAEELLSGKSGKVPFRTEDEAVKRGCIFRKKLPFTSFAIKDGKLITGQNPMSGRAVAKLLTEDIKAVK